MSEVPAMRLAACTIMCLMFQTLAAANTSNFDRDTLNSTRLSVPSQTDFASGVGRIGDQLDNYGNPADIFSKHRTLNFSIGQSHWPLFPFLSWTYSAQMPFKVGVGTPIGESYVSSTLLLNYLFYGCCPPPFRRRLHRGLIGGDFHISHKRKWGLSGRWLTTQPTLTAATHTSVSEESVFGLRMGGKLGQRHGWVGTLDRHKRQFSSLKLEFSILFSNYSLSYRYNTHHTKDRRLIMWNSGLVFRVSQKRRFHVKPLWGWWTGRLSASTGRAGLGSYLGRLHCYRCGGRQFNVLEGEIRAGGEYRWKDSPWTLAIQAGFIGSTDRHGVWNEGIFHRTAIGQIGIAARFIRQTQNNRQWAYTIGYEQFLPCLWIPQCLWNLDRIELDEIGGHFVRFGFHQRIEWRYTF